MVRSFVAALLIWSSAAFAQVQETVDVNVSSLDVVVTDSKGNPVRGLTQADFQVLDKGRPRPITNFSVLTAGTPAEGQAIAPSRNVLLLFDSTSLGMGARRTTINAAKEWIEREMRPSDRVQVMAAIPSLQRRQAWTREKTEVLAALDAVAGETAAGLETERRESERRIESVIDRARAAQQGSMIRVTFDEATQAIRVYAASAKRHSEILLGSIGAAMLSFPPGGGRNVLLLIGEGVAPNPGSEMFNYLNAVKMDIEAGIGPGMLRAGAQTASPLTEASQFDLTPQFRKLNKDAIRSGVAIYAIAPISAEGDSTASVETMAPSSASSRFAKGTGNAGGYDFLARDTGGTVFISAPPQYAISRIAAELGAWYSIGYTPNATEGEISVKVRGKNVRFSRAAAPQSPDQIMRDTVVANQLTSVPSNDLGISVTTDPPVAEGLNQRVKVKVLIPIDKLKLVPQGQEVTGSFAVYVVSGNERGEGTEINRQSHAIKWPGDAPENLKGKSMTFVVDVFVPNGLDQISVGVIDETSGQTGFAKTKL